MGSPGVRLILKSLSWGGAGLQFDDDFARSQTDGLGCIGAEIEQYLVNLVRVSQDSGRVLAELGADRDVLGKGGAQHPGGFKDDRRQFHDFLLSPVFATEGQDLVHQGLGSQGGLSDFHQRLVIEGVLAFLRYHYFGIGQDNGENVIEVMGDPTSQGANGFHFLCVAQFRLQDLLIPGCNDATELHSGTFGKNPEEGFLFGVVSHGPGVHDKQEAYGFSIARFQGQSQVAFRLHFDQSHILWKYFLHVAPIETKISSNRVRTGGILEEVLKGVQKSAALHSTKGTHPVHPASFEVQFQFANAGKLHLQGSGDGPDQGFKVLIARFG